MYERNSTLVQKKFKEYLFPTIMTSLAMSLASVIDSIIVGNLLGDQALAAIGLSGPIIFCLNTIYMLFGVGGITCASVAKGQLDKKRANQVFTVAMVVGIGVMTLFLIVVNLFMGVITSGLAAGDVELATLTATYIRPLLFTGPALMFSSGLALFVRTDGDPKSSARIVVVANVVNLILDYILIRYCNAGIAGAGLSTTLGYIAGGFVVLPYLFSKKRSFLFDFPKLSELNVVIDVMKTGMPKALTQVASFLRAIVLNGIVMMALGSIGMSVMTVCLNVLMISNIFVGGTSDSLLPIVGTLYGERDYYGIRQAVYKARTVLIFACIGLVAFFVIRPEAVGNWFGLNTPEGLEVLVPALRMFALYLPFQAVNTTLQNFYNITGRKSLASMIATLDGLIYVCLFAFVLAQVSGTLFWFCYACSGCATMLTVFFIGYRIKKQEDVTGFLLLREENEEGVQWDITIHASNEDAVSLSDKVIDFCIQNQVDKIMANHIGIAIEEMVVNTAKVNEEREEIPTIDIFIRILSDKILVRFRDDGDMFDVSTDLTEAEEENMANGICVMNKMASSVEYAVQLGFNTTIFTLDLI